MAQHDNAPAEQRRGGVDGFRKVAREVQHISRMQLDDAMLERLGQKPDTRPSPDVAPDFVFYTGCNVLKTPHIALLALDIMDTLGITYKVMGGPSHCCGVVQMRTGDVATSGRFAEATMDKLAAGKTKEVLAWCPSCHTQFNETTLPTVEKTRGAKPFEMTPFMLFLRRHLDRLRPLLTAARGDARRAAPPSRHPGRGAGGGGHAERGAGDRARRSEAARGRHDGATISARCRPIAASCRVTSSPPPSGPASTRWSRSITPTTASCARTSATTRSGS